MIARQQLLAAAVAAFAAEGNPGDRPIGKPGGPQGDLPAFLPPVEVRTVIPDHQPDRGVTVFDQVVDDRPGGVEGVLLTKGFGGLFYSLFLQMWRDFMSKARLGVRNF
jgi:hypothetical protein